MPTYQRNTLLRKTYQPDKAMIKKPCSKGKKFLARVSSKTNEFLLSEGAMASVNKVILIGNLGKDPELKFLPSGQPVANFSIATSEKWKDKSTGETKEQTEWHNIIMFGKLAEIAGQYLKKGSSVFVEGRLQTRKWQDKNGQDRYTTEIIANEMKMLGGRGDQSSGSTSDSQSKELKQGYYQPQPLNQREIKRHLMRSLLLGLMTMCPSENLEK